MRPGTSIYLCVQVEEQIALITIRMSFTALPDEQDRITHGLQLAFKLPGKLKLSALGFRFSVPSLA